MCGNVAHQCQAFVTAVEVNISCKIVHVKGHADHPWNELCDALTKLAAHTQSILEWPRLSELINCSLDSAGHNSRCKQLMWLFLHYDVGTNIAPDCGGWKIGGKPSEHDTGYSHPSLTPEGHGNAHSWRTAFGWQIRRWATRPFSSPIGPHSSGCCSWRRNLRVGRR